MSDIAEKLRAAIEAKEAFENARTKEVAWHACPTCGERADRYRIEEMNFRDIRHHTVKLFPCEAAGLADADTAEQFGPRPKGEAP